MTEYVLGFCYNKKVVLLLKKNKPEWQAGCWNGLGGHIEMYETPHYAMSREFNEEVEGATLDTKPEDWRYVCTFRGEDYKVHTFGLYREFDGPIDKEVKEGRLETLPYVFLANDKKVSNLEWLIPLVTCGNTYGTLGQSEIWENIEGEIK